MSRENEEFVRGIFRKWDVDGDLQLDEIEFIRLFTDLGMSEDSAKQIFKAVDMDGDGYVDADELLDWLEFSGKSSYVTGGGLSAGTGSKEAAAHIKSELKNKPPEGPKYCCEITTSLATLKCVQCNKLYSQAGFDRSHDKGKLREHNTIPFTQALKEKATHKGKAIQMLEAMRQSEARGALELELKKQFRLYDLDANGCISMEEMTQIALAMNKFCEEDDAASSEKVRKQAYKLFKQLDLNGDGSVVMGEFIEALVDNSMVEYGPELAARRAKDMTESIKIAMQKAGPAKKS
mmetsp:Transcript_86767/g.136888  ORF Transcript_86767/g.136888 Transcript_86767/m.136888 type:complete len:292 (-) Transcript_86767:44-919(-)